MLHLRMSPKKTHGILARQTPGPLLSLNCRQMSLLSTPHLQGFLPLISSVQMPCFLLTLHPSISSFSFTSHPQYGIYLRQVPTCTHLSKLRVFTLLGSFSLRSSAYGLDYRTTLHFCWASHTHTPPFRVQLAQPEQFSRSLY